MEDQVYGRRYRVTERIGTGGMADVYKAVDDVLGRTVAVKVLHPRYASDPNFVARFRQEAQAAANLSNPHIVNIYDWGQEDSTYYIVMEYVRGTDLKSLIDEKGPTDPTKAAEYAAQVCSALAVAHSYDVIHRDIKPHNIVLMPDGTVKVMDFGIARAGNTTMTQTGSVLGTAQYISPEQAQGRPLGPASDLYSLGIVLYEMTTGRLPFEADTPVAVALKQVNEQPRAPREINPAVPPALEAVILRAMEKDPAVRYASADEMRDDLRRVIAGQPVAAIPMHMDRTSVLPTVGAAEQPRPIRRVVEQPRGRSPWGWIVALILLVLLGGIVAYAAGLFPGGTVTVPDVTNMTVSEATASLEAVGLKAGEIKTQNNDTVKAGIVFDQSPPREVKVDKGTAVNLTVSAGRATVEIPDLTGMTGDDAIRAIQAAGLRFGTSDSEFSKSPKGTVVKQDPPPLAKVDANTTVSFTLSLGPQQATVPDVKGRTRPDATSALKSAGFKVKATEVFSTEVAAGLVIDSDPSAGAQVDKGTTVTIRVSKGPEAVTVPNLFGQPTGDAQAKLESLGFAVDLQTVPAPTPADVGKVVNQNPAGGTKAQKGSSVTLFIGSGSP